MKNKRSLLKYLLIIFTCGIIGAIISYLLSNNIIDARGIWNNAVTVFKAHLNTISYICYVVLGLLTYYLYYKLIHFTQGDLEEDEFYALQTQKTHYVFIFNSANTIISLTLYLLQLHMHFYDMGPHQDTHLQALDIFIFLFVIFYCVFIEVKTIHFQKKENPEKRGDPLQFRFEKDWLDSCDEAEKIIIYHASYKAFQLMRYSYTAALLLIMFLNFIYNTGMLPTFIVGAMYFIQTISYQLYYIKLSRKIN